MKGEDTMIKKTIIVSNRLPVTIINADDKISYKNSEGGLATGLGSIYKKGNNLWIGWPGTVVPGDNKEEVTDMLAPENLVPVFLTADEIESFYKGFSNETLWPLFHYFPTYAKFDERFWRSYVAVNRKYTNAILQVANPNDTIWIHDYQLMLVPMMLREQLPDAEIGFFQHIPFPSQELFRILPWRQELLNGVLGADVVGFHTYDDVRHFLSAVSRITKLEVSSHEIQVHNRIVVADAFPISIDYKHYSKLAESTQTHRNRKKIRQMSDNTKLLISIDRLDYSKGIIHRLKAFDLFLQQHPEWHEKLTYVHLVVPSRDSVTKYKELKEEMNKLISEINGSYSTLDWQPIQYFYRSFPPHLLSALYKAADVALVTPMRDGMNLVSKEYVASKTDLNGVLVLSETAGAAIELPEAVMVNPNDIWSFAGKIQQALTMPEAEKKYRMTQMQQTVSKFNIHTWVKNFMDKLRETKQKQEKQFAKTLTGSIRKNILEKYLNSNSRLLLLDYDGTLVPFSREFNEATPDSTLLNLLKNLAADPKNKVVIISGRDHLTLEEWLGHIDIDMVAEHGIWYRNGHKKWHAMMGLNNGWRKDIYNIMSLYVDRTPGTLIEQKSYSLAWHYRKAETGLGFLRAEQLVNDMKHFTYENNLQILQGDKVIEVKNASINKGIASARWLEGQKYDFVFAIGDDTTDEDIFKAMPENAITIKVGDKMSAAAYNIDDHVQARSLLNDMYEQAKPRAKSLQKSQSFRQRQGDPIS